MQRFTTHRRVHYRDTDQMGVVYHGVYFEFFETGRTEWLRSIGMPYTAFEERGLIIVVLAAHAQFIVPARYDDDLAITAIIENPSGARLKIEYEIHNAENQLLAKGHTLHAFADKATMRAMRPPQDFIDAIENNSERHHR